MQGLLISILPIANNTCYESLAWYIGILETLQITTSRSNDITNPNMLWITTSRLDHQTPEITNFKSTILYY
jgi:hypothetical protein